MNSVDVFATDNRLPAFRIKQFNQACYKEFISSYDELTTWSKELRDKLKTSIPFTTIEFVRQVDSADKETSKVLFKRTSDGALFEAVLMRHEDGRNTVCVSCMIGCPVGCTFCATGKMKFVGNLTNREIVDQVLYFARLLKKDQQGVTNIVFMGMGEPLLNLAEVIKAIRFLNDEKYTGYGIRRFTISTSGITPKINELWKQGYRGRLTLSLHAPNQALREKLMPIAKHYPLSALMAAVSDFAVRSQLRVSYEYILIDGVNNLPEHARQLVDLLKENRPDLAHVNLIPYNPVIGAPYKRPPAKSVYAFADILDHFGISNTFRVTMGDDIQAACGQLAT